jgi:hypothetical protein
MLSSRDAFIKAAEKIAPRLWKLTFLSIAVVALVGIIGGVVVGSRTQSPGWASLSFMYGAWITLAVAIPVTLCVFVGAVFIYGFILFLYFRFRVPKA